ncbi:hypothetical protein XELAEV_18023308mg, partial [Xenopus laevis]
MNNCPQPKHSILGIPLLKNTSKQSENKLKILTASPRLPTLKCTSAGNESVIAAENSKRIRKLIYILKNNSSNRYKVYNDCNTKNKRYTEANEKTIEAFISPLCIIHDNDNGEKEVAEETDCPTPPDIMIQTSADGNIHTYVTKLSEENKLLVNDTSTSKGREFEQKDPRCDLIPYPSSCSTSPVSVIKRICNSGREKCTRYESTKNISKAGVRELKSGMVRIFPLSGKENTSQRQ